MKAGAGIRALQESIIFRGLKLGIAALVLNMALLWLGGGALAPLGNIALFVAAGALPVSGVLVALGSALIPLALYTPDSGIEQLRVALVCLAVWHISRRSPFLPPFLIVLGMWVLVFWPAAFLTLPPESLNGPMIVINGLTEIFLVLIAGSILLNPRVWWHLVDQTRQVHPSVLLEHAFPAIAAAAMIGVAAFSGITSLPSSPLQTPVNLSGLVIFCILILLAGAHIGNRLSSLMERPSTDRVTGMLGLQRAFSGMASQYWRRQHEEEVRHDTEAISAKLEGLSANPREDGGPAERQLAHSDVGICLLNKDGTIGFVNRKFRQFSGITLNIVNGKRLDLVGIDASLAQHMLMMLDRTLTNGVEVAEVKVNQIPDKLRFFEICAQRGDTVTHSTLGGDDSTVVVILRDITDRRTIESNLLKAQKLESLGIMVKGLALAFNNALSRIAAETSVALRENEASSFKEALVKIAAEVKDTSRITHQLMDFAHDQPAALETDDLEQLIRKRLDLLKGSMGEGREIIFENSRGRICALVDTGLFTQALTNLILNAGEAYPDGKGIINVSLGTEYIEEEISRFHAGTRPGHFARVRVRDSGLGMTTEVLERAFNPLFTTKSGEGHAGLGLSTVFAIVRAHDGFLTAESHPGKGSTISMYFPLQISGEAAVKTPDSTAEESDVPAGRGERIFIVEEDPALRSLGSRMIESLGYSCTAVEGGDELSPGSPEFSADLVLIDIDGGKGNHEALIERLNSTGVRWASIGSRTIPGNNFQNTGLFLRKPFDVGTCGRFIHQALQRR